MNYLERAAKVIPLISANNVSGIRVILNAKDREWINCPAGLGDGKALMHIAAEQAMRPDVILELHRHGAVVNTAILESLTPLHVAVKSNKNRDPNRIVSGIIDILIDLGAKIEAKTSSGLTPLHYAAVKAGKTEAEALLRRAADPNATCESGMTPLMYWAKYMPHDTEFGMLLLNSGADPTLADKSGRLAHEFCAGTDEAGLVQATIAKHRLSCHSKKTCGPK